jgi:hypothetical protein
VREGAGSERSEMSSGSGVVSMSEGGRLSARATSRGVRSERGRAEEGKALEACSWDSARGSSVEATGEEEEALLGHEDEDRRRGVVSEREGPEGEPGACWRRGREGGRGKSRGA